MSTTGARERGLPSVNQAKAEHRRAIVMGRVRLRGMPPHFWLWTLTILGVFSVVYWRVAEGHLESRKAQVMSKQRAIAKTIGPKILPFRDRVEGWARELAGPYPGDLVSNTAELELIEQSPGVYLRLRIGVATTPRDIRKAARTSLHDGFTSCLFRKTKTGDPTKGPPCKATAECTPGLLCNEWSVCAEPPIPYNMRLAYRTLRVLSPEWTDELHKATSDLAINAYDRDLDSVTRYDVRIAADILARSKFFTLVLDEDPSAGLPSEIPDAGETPEERVQRAAHPARVGIWDLATGKPLLRLRAQAAGEFVPMGGRTIRDPITLAAEQRQVNACQLALEVRAKLSPGE
ncbi:MAG TPA: hypothetical protein VFZ53_04490 [Polyangiaceae bacterium]